MKHSLLRFSLPFVLLATSFTASFAQNQGTLSGDIMTNANFFQRDTAINAADNPLYDNLLSGGEAWMSLRYSNYGFTGFLRMDAFHNSNLQNPTQPMSNFGIGAWSISKEWKKLTATGGYIYDQIGSGILFRSYEDRGLLIDNALVGLSLKYELTPEIMVKGFTGQQKNLFQRYQPVIKGINIEGDWQVGKTVHITPGFGALNRTLDKASMDNVVNNINNLPLSDRFVPSYNMYAFTLYNTLTAGDFSWYIEGAYKTSEAINDLAGVLTGSDGNIVYSTLGYARKGIAVTLSGKRTEHFVMRTSPNEILNFGMLNWQPIIAQIRSQRLIARYTPPSLDFSEIGGAANVLINPNDNIDLNLSYTHINTLDDLKLYREFYAEANFRGLGEKVLLDVGAQYLEYNQEFYQSKAGWGTVKAITPFAEFTYRVTRNQSLKVQAQYMSTEQDFGSWAFLGLEYAIAPKWSFALSDMYNTDPKRTDISGRHFYNVFVAYTAGAHRFSLAYVKQVEGVNCTGGVCRYEPAFSGLKLGITSSF